MAEVACSISNLNAVDGRDAKPNDILGPAMSVPFLSARRLVLVEHFLERFERRGGQGPRSLEAFEPLFAGLEAGIPETTLLVFFGQPFLAPGGLKTFVTKANPMVSARIKRTKASNEEHPELKEGTHPGNSKRGSPAWCSLSNGQGRRSASSRASSCLMNPTPQHSSRTLSLAICSPSRTNSISSPSTATATTSPWSK